LYWVNSAVLLLLGALIWRTAGVPALAFILVVAALVDFIALRTSNVPFPYHRFVGINVGVFGGWLGGWLIGSDLNPTVGEFALVLGVLGVVNARAITQVVARRFVWRGESRNAENDPGMNG
jgi:hypothetical protein